LAVTQRLQRLRRKIEESDFETILISQPENRYYLSGFASSAGFLIVSSKSALLATDFRYAEQARREAPDFEVVQIKGKLVEWLFSLILELGIKKLGFEASDISFATYHQLIKAIDEGGSEFQLTPTEGLVESLRAVKEEEELVQLSKAAELADSSFEYIASEIHPGIREKEVAWGIEKFLRERGSENLPFDIIVASGPNSAFPHAKPTERIIQPGEPIILDFGARVGGYCSDFTRTICLNSVDKSFAKIYDLVLGAQLIALATLETGMNGEQADQLARTIIEQGGYKDAFGHGLGHGVGLAVHEEPSLSSKSEDILAENMVFTVEPGIYLPNWGGVRIEDMVVLQEGKARLLTKAEKLRTGGS
jgi:Xaa-Pro aminopeptidase